MYIFLRETKLIIDRGEWYPAIHLDTLSSLTCDQTFKESTLDRKSLHSNNRFLKHRKTRANNLITGTMSLYLTDSGNELSLFELAGWSNTGRTLLYPDSISNLPELFDLILYNSAGTYRLSNCAITTIDISLNKTFSGGITVGFEASDMDFTTYDMSNVDIVQGQHIKPSPIDFIFGVNYRQSMTSVGISFSRELTPLEEATIHNSNSIIKPNKRVISDINMDITTQCYNNMVPIDKYDSVSITQANISISLDNAIITKRDSVSDIYITSYDISPTEYTNNISITY